ncbi:MAG: hypothetical protein H6555_09735 [Lewinellaceae bacterium]|nr:hypothetical protein [Lewinellaceae bacterium]
MGLGHLFEWTSTFSYYFIALLVILGAGVAQALGVGGLFFLKQSGERRANAFYGGLLLTFGFTLLHYLLVISGFFSHFPPWRFLPIYFTLALPVFLFFYVKLSMYPAYRLRWTDAKHFILPTGQFLFFLVLFLQSPEVKITWDRRFFNPFYGAAETLLYLTTFPAYLYFAYRYVRRRRRSTHSRGEMRLVIYCEKLLQVLLILFAIHAVFVLSDFISYEFLQRNLRSLNWYAALGVLSFAALGFWLSTYGFQILIWGRKLFR